MPLSAFWFTGRLHEVTIYFVDWYDSVPGPCGKLCTSRAGHHWNVWQDIHTYTFPGERVCWPLHLHDRRQSGMMGRVGKGEQLSCGNKYMANTVSVKLSTTTKCHNTTLFPQVVCVCYDEFMMQTICVGTIFRDYIIVSHNLFLKPYAWWKCTQPSDNDIISVNFPPSKHFYVYSIIWSPVYLTYCWDISKIFNFTTETADIYTSILLPVPNSCGYDLNISQQWLYRFWQNLCLAHVHNMVFLTILQLISCSTSSRHQKFYLYNQIVLFLVWQASVYFNSI